ncbi:hypothetical protein XU18_0133 [Perkinsela sp. CCAP 1560/4]|nr:hypothetical protein XU18_0133 [Perkinsela sp. CCAP 1560/4]|eukprot:KNH09448.1 hypothetical protein XU18_0133 [Perkinsela sp. CCAP 1560/4]
MLCPLMQLYFVHAPVVLPFSATISENIPVEENAYSQREHRQGLSDAESDAFSVLQALRAVFCCIQNFINWICSPFTRVRSILSESRTQPADHKQPKGRSRIDNSDKKPNSLSKGRSKEELEVPSRDATELVSAINQGYIRKKCEGADFDKMTEGEARDFVENYLHDVPPPLPTPRPKLSTSLARERRLRMSPAPRRPEEVETKEASTEASNDMRMGDHRRHRMNVNFL